VSSLVRKTNSINNSQFGRRKYKKLKKKYWGRLDIVEKYINSIKNSITIGDNSSLISKFYTIGGKPIQTQLSIISNDNLDFNKNLEKNKLFEKNTNSFSEKFNFFIKNNLNFFGISKFF
jgi:hypothetical protein